MRVRMKDIAARANVSTSTVSKVLRGKGNVSPEKRKEILSIAEELNYDLAASQRRLKIAVISGFLEVSNSHVYAGFLKGINEELGGSVSLIASVKKSDTFPLNVVLSNPKSIDGAIFFAVEADHPVVQRFLQHDMKCVLINRYTDDERISTVNLNNQQVFYEATKHLLEHGHRRIAYIYTEPITSWSKARQTGYIQCMKQHGGEPLCFGVPGPTAKAPYDTVKKSLPDVTAIVAENDSLAISVMQNAQERGINLPEQLAVFGCDNTAEGRELVPALSTIEVPAKQMGERAAKLMRELLKDSTWSARITLAGEMIYRASCGC